LIDTIFIFCAGVTQRLGILPCLNMYINSGDDAVSDVKI